GESETTQNDVNAKAEYKRLLSERFFAGLGTTFLYDDIADVDYRVNLNPSLGYFLIREENIRFNIEGGPTYVFEKVGGVKDDYLAPRVAERFEWSFSETGKLFQTAE